MQNLLTPVSRLLALLISQPLSSHLQIYKITWLHYKLNKPMISDPGELLKSELTYLLDNCNGQLKMCM